MIELFLSNHFDIQLRQDPPKSTAICIAGPDIDLRIVRADKNRTNRLKQGILLAFRLFNINLFFLVAAFLLFASLLLPSISFATTTLRGRLPILFILFYNLPFLLLADLILATMSILRPQGDSEYSLLKVTVLSFVKHLPKG